MDLNRLSMDLTAALEESRRAAARGGAAYIRPRRPNTKLTTIFDRLANTAMNAQNPIVIAVPRTKMRCCVERAMSAVVASTSELMPTGVPEITSIKYPSTTAPAATGARCGRVV